MAEIEKIKASYPGLIDKAVRFLMENQLTDSLMWHRFVEEYRLQEDAEESGWRGEFWGKTMRGGVLVYTYSRDPKLYDSLTEAVRDLLTVKDSDNRVSTYKKEGEYHGWDIWCRKYVMLGMEYYLSICKSEELKEQIIDFLRVIADDLLTDIGTNKGQIRITETSEKWLGVNSSSVLEPIVRLYELTGDKRYLDFAGYIISEGGAKGVPFFEYAYEDVLLPYQYGIEKAYEMISCFEGLVRYSMVTGIKKYREAAIRFGKAVLKSDVTIIGSCGCTHELFDHSKARQTSHYEDVMQETCVTVTWMKFLKVLADLTGDETFTDAIEQSFYNAYLGALNEEKKLSPYAKAKFVDKLGYTIQDTVLPFDSYSPLTRGMRGVKIGGNQLLYDHSIYGCCAAIGAAGLGIFAEHMVTANDDTIFVHFYEAGETIFKKGNDTITVKVSGDYPKSGDISVTLLLTNPDTFSLSLRIPSWASEYTSNEEGVFSKELHTLTIRRKWNKENEIRLHLPMEFRFVFPEIWDTDMVLPIHHGSEIPKEKVEIHQEEEARHYVSVMRGPITFGMDERFSENFGEPIPMDHLSATLVDNITDKEGAAFPTLVAGKLHISSGKDISICDYQSIGKDWESEIMAWIKTK